MIIQSSLLTQQVNLLLGFEGVNYTSDDYWTAKLLSLILGGGMTSRLFQEIREKRGLVYLIRAMSNSDADTGMLSIYAGTGEKEIGELEEYLEKIDVTYKGDVDEEAICDGNNEVIVKIDGLKDGSYEESDLTTKLVRFTYCKVEAADD